MSEHKPYRPAAKKPAQQTRAKGRFVDTAPMEEGSRVEQGVDEKSGFETPPEDATQPPVASVEIDELGLLKAALEKAQQDTKEEHEALLRTAAEFENYKKRMQKEQQERLKYAGRELVLDVVGALDNLARAMQAANNTQKSTDGSMSKTLLQGVEMVSKQLGNALQKHHVTRIEAKGKAFDPSQHEAMQAVPTADFPQNQVLQELRTGWLLHERVIRPAMVSVAAPLPEANPDTLPQQENPAPEPANES